MAQIEQCFFVFLAA